MEPGSPALQGNSLLSEPSGKPITHYFLAAFLAIFESIFWSNHFQINSEPSASCENTCTGSSGFEEKLTGAHLPVQPHPAPPPLVLRAPDTLTFFRFFKPSQLPLTSGLLHKLLPLPGTPTHPSRLGRSRITSSGRPCPASLTRSDLSMEPRKSPPQHFSESSFDTFSRSY